MTSPPSPIGPMPVSLRSWNSSSSELSDDRIGVAGADRPGDRLLGEVHRVVGGAADADTDDAGRARLAAGADDRLQHELLDALHPVGGDASSGKLMFSEPEPLGTHFTSRPSHSGMNSQCTIGKR